MLAQLYWTVAAATAVMGCPTRIPDYRLFKMPAVGVGNVVEGNVPDKESFAECKAEAIIQGAPAFSWLEAFDNKICLVMLDFNMAGVCENSTVGDDVYVQWPDAYQITSSKKFQHQMDPMFDLRYFDTTYLRSLKTEAFDTIRFAPFPGETPFECAAPPITNLYWEGACEMLVGFLDIETCTNADCTASDALIATNVKLAEKIHPSSFLELCGTEMTDSDFDQDKELQIMSHKGFGCQAIPAPDSNQTCTVTVTWNTTTSSSSKFKVIFATGFYLSDLSGDECAGDRLQMISNPGSSDEEQSETCILENTDENSVEYRTDRLQLDLMQFAATEKGLGFFLNIIRE